MNSSIPLGADALLVERDRIEDLLAASEDWRALMQLRSRQERGEGLSAAKSARLEAALLDALDEDPNFERYKEVCAALELLIRGRANIRAAAPILQAAHLSQTGSQHVPQEAVAATPRDADDLTRIRGIDAALARQLRSLRTETFAEIAEWRAADIQRVAADLGLGKQIYSQNWIEQAALLALSSPHKAPVRTKPVEVVVAATPVAKPAIKVVAKPEPVASPPPPPAVEPKKSVPIAEVREATPAAASNEKPADRVDDKKPARSAAPVADANPSELPIDDPDQLTLQLRPESQKGAQPVAVPKAAETPPAKPIEKVAEKPAAKIVELVAAKPVSAPVSEAAASPVPLRARLEAVAALEAANASAPNGAGKAATPGVRDERGAEKAEMRGGNTTLEPQPTPLIPTRSTAPAAAVSASPTADAKPKEAQAADIKSEAAIFDRVPPKPLVVTRASLPPQPVAAPAPIKPAAPPVKPVEAAVATRSPSAPPVASAPPLPPVNAAAQKPTAPPPSNQASMTISEAIAYAAEVARQGPRAPGADLPNRTAAAAQSTPATPVAKVVPNVSSPRAVTPQAPPPPLAAMPPPLPPPIVLPQVPASNGPRGKAPNGSQNGQPQGGRVTRPDRLDYGGMRLNLEEASVEIVRRSTSGAPIVPEAAPAIAVSAEPMLPEAATAMPESRAPKTMGRFLKALTGN